MKFLSSFLIAGLLAAPALAVAQTAERAETATALVVDLARATRAPASAPPAMAVVVVRPGAAPTVWVDGVADVRTRVRADADTPFYVASMTKAYVGLMAATLDQRGVFDLDQTMTDVWPGLIVEGRDPSKITFRQLLSHQAAIENGDLTEATAYVREIPAGDYAAFLARSTPREEGFDYDNLGYVVYGAALELKTGRHWRDWLDETVIRPLGMTHTGARTSGWAAPAAGHEWIGDGRWQARTVKADELMHAAGGLMTSADDMARWLAANADRTALPTAAYEQAQTSLVAAEADQEGIACQGYSLGWRTCLVAGEPVLLHGGGYTGARSGMAIMPRLGVGVAVMTNSDSMTGYLSGALIKAFLSNLLDPTYQPERPEAFGAAFGERLSAQMRRRQDRLAQALAEPMWRGWAWTPDVKALDAYVGRYRAKLGEVTITREGDGLRLRLGAFERILTPAAPDLFGAQSSPIAPPEQTRFVRENGRIVGVEWEGDRLPRID